MDDMKRTAKDMIDQVSDAIPDDVQSQAQAYTGQARDKVSETVAFATDAAQDLYGRARGRVQDAAESLPGSAADAVNTGKRAYARSSRQLSRQVTKQPIEALLLAGAIGYLVGWATNRT